MNKTNERQRISGISPYVQGLLLPDMQPKKDMQMTNDIQPNNERQAGGSSKPPVSSSTVYNEDCMTVMARYPDKFFDLAIVDPPYGVGIAKWDKEIPNDDYFKELFRVSKNQIIWGGNFFCLPPTRCYIVWNKKQWLKVRSSLEYAWTSFDGLPYYLEYTYCGNAEGMDKIRVDYNKKSIHPCQKPVNVYQLIIEQFGMDANIILDTHLGSGSSRIAANKLNKDFIGCEIDAEYFAAQEARFKEFTSQLRLFG